MMFDLDNTIKPDEDFYQHVNMKWLNKTTIPDDNMIWNVFNELNEDNLLKSKDMLEKNKKTTDLNFIKLITLYNQSLVFTQTTPSINHSKLEGSFDQDVAQYIGMISQVKTIKELRHILIDLFTLNGITNTNNFYVYNDLNNSKRNILHIDTGGLGLPDRDYYFNKDKNDIRIEYKKFMKEFLEYFNLKFNIETIYGIEEKLAEFTFTNVEKRDMSKMNNMTDIKCIKSVNPILYDDLIYYFNKINIKPQQINIINPKFTFAYYELLNIFNLNQWKEYFIYLFLRKMGNYIDINSETILFNFYNKTLSGVKKMKEPFKRSIENMNNLVGMLVGEMFVNEYFNQESKKKVIEILQFIKNELGNRLRQNDWMEDITKNNALKKLDKMQFKVGYPDVWMNHNDLVINSENSFFMNVINCYRFDYNYNLAYLYQPIDRTRWLMNPHEINAYYSPSYNEIVFPCGILLPPFFSLDQDIGSNFGGIGCIIGHEITHGFDDMGRKFNEDGNLVDWWTEKDCMQYNIKSLVLKNIFNKLKIENIKVNGELTLGENIADLGGVEISFNSLKKYIESYEEHVLYKNKSFKMFFYNYANIWKYLIRKEEAIKRLVTDTHSPPHYRVNTILSNTNDFYKCFNIMKGSKMWIDEIDRASIW
jgi:putative endopeptidase